MQGWIKENNIKNVKVKGIFDESDTLDYFEGVDAVLNMYGNHNPYYDFALSNKLYLAAELRLPIITCPDTAMSEMAEKYKIGTSVDIDKISDKDDLYQYLSTYKSSQFQYGCNRLILDALHDMKIFREEVRKFISE